MRSYMVRLIYKIFLYSLLVGGIFILFAYEGAFVLEKTRNAQLDEALDQAFIHDSKSHGVGVYTINLKQHGDKYKKTHNQLQHINLPLHRVEAIDAKDLSDKDIANYLDLHSYQAFMGHNPRKGTIGCYLSHMKAWKAFLKSDYEFALITEDDIEFDPDVLTKTIDELIKVRYLWSITLFEILHGGMPLVLKEFEDIDQTLDIYLLQVTHAGAYMINRSAAYRLLEKALPIKMPLDHYFLRSWEWSGLLVTGIEPRIVSQPPRDRAASYRESTDYVGGKERKEVPWSSTMHKVIYIIKSGVIRFIYNLAQYVAIKYQDQSESVQ